MPDVPVCRGMLAFFNHVARSFLVLFPRGGVLAVVLQPMYRPSRGWLDCQPANKPTLPLSLSQVADVWKRVYARYLHLLALLQFRMPVRSWLCLERLPTVLSPVQGKFESVNRPLTRQDRQCVVSPFVGDACANGHEVGSSHDHSLVQGIGGGIA